MKIRIRNLDPLNPFSTDFISADGSSIRLLVPPGGTVEQPNVDPYYLAQDHILRQLVAPDHGQIVYTPTADGYICSRPGGVIEIEFVRDLDDVVALVIPPGTASGGGITAISGGTTNAIGPQVIFSNSPTVTFGVAGNTVTASAAGGAGGGVALSAGTSSISTGTIVFSNSNGLAFGLSGSTITGSYTLPPTGLTNVNVSAGTTSNNLSALVFSDSNGLAFGLAGSTITGSYSQSTHSHSTGPGALAAGTQTATSGTIIFSDSNNVTFGMSGSTRITASASFPAETPFAVSGGTQSVSTGTLVFSDSNNVTFGMSGSSRITASASFPAETPFGLSAGTQSVSTGTLIFSNSFNVSFGMSGSSRVTASASFPAETPFGLSAGTQSVSTGTLVFSDSNNVTFGMSGSSRVTASASFPPETPFGLSAGTQSVSTGTLVFSNSFNVSFGMSGSSRVTASASFPAETPFGVSAGTQSVSTGTLVFSDSNNVTFGMSGSSRITASASFPAETPFGISAGTQSVSTGTLVFSNSNGLSFGMSGSSRVTGSYASYATAFSQHADFATNFSISNATLSLQKMSTPLYVSATRALFLMDLSGNTNSSGALSISMGIYTMSGSTASLASSASRQLSWTSGSETTASSIYGGQSGTRYRTLGVAFNMTPGDYLVAWHFRTTNNGTWRAFGRPAANIVGALDGAETNYYLDGTSNASFTTALLASLNVTDTNYARTGAAAQRQPGFVLVGSF